MELDLHLHHPTPVSTMDPAMYMAAQKGDLHYLKSRIESRLIISLVSMLTPQCNTILHLATTFMQLEFAAEVLQHEKSLLFRPNSKGDTPLHIAAQSGDLRMVKLLIHHYRESQTTSQQLPLDLESGISQWRATNSDGNTVLHEALIRKQPQVALLLLKEDPGLANCVNNSTESPLYLAANLGFECVAERIMCIGLEYTISFKGPRGRTPLHGVALFWPYMEKRHQTREALAHQEVITRLLCQNVQTIISQRDDFGRTVLHYAVAGGAERFSGILLEADHTLAYITDKDGLTPLLIAVTLARRRTAKLILHHFPDCAELHDLNGQNAHHLAMRDYLFIPNIMKHPVFQLLLNERDNDGNTPLHLAVKNHFYHGIIQLLQYKGINLRTQNREGHTAFDVLEKWDSIYLKNRFKRELLRHGATRGWKPFVLKYFIKDTYKAPVDELKQLANTLLVVTTLILTISFTAAFTLPGGYSQDPSDIGLAVLGKKAAFQIFLFCDAVAVCSSVTCAYFLIAGLIRNFFLRSALAHAILWLTVALFATMIAFSTGLYLVTENKCKWLAIFIILMSCSIPSWLRLIGDSILHMLPSQERDDKSADKML